ncbi:MAG: diphosphate--fructose-6-phosphate 1-phosphotransferase [Rhabdochlamydiaceae bacterium]|nr:diphosphate--fructose-6-phosphate 1-phosphotransferase [Rhabdochlamydiaceae bacterium]
MQSPLELLRTRFHPFLPPCLLDITSYTLHEDSHKIPFKKELLPLFPFGSTLSLMRGAKGSLPSLRPMKIGVVFSGGQAPGGHNVIAGLFDALQTLSAENELIGFLEGPAGILKGKSRIISKEEMEKFLNTGGFDLLGSGRTKIETIEQFEQAKVTCQKLSLDALVIIGGDDSNTNAALLTEYFHQEKCATCVIGIPKTIDGDLKNEYVPISFGFDTASKVYAELIGNLARDALSAKKYYHFVRLMGRTASHIALECALLTHPNYAFIAEEVAAKKMTLQQVVSELCTLILERSAIGKSYGVILIPEGLIEWIPEMSRLIQELNILLAQKDLSEDEAIQKLSQESSACFSLLPSSIQKQLLLTRDSHGNVQVSLIETERLLAELVSIEMQKHKQVAFHPLTHFFGYEGRAAFPSNFDASYCYTLGYVAAIGAIHKLSGYMCFVSNLHEPIANWSIGAVPFASLMHTEIRKGKEKPVLAKALVSLEGKAFKSFVKQRDAWKKEDHYTFPGPMQFEGDVSVCYAPPLSLQLENS